MIVVSGRFREIVDQFEPGVHQFLPVRYVEQANVLAERYFITCNRLDSVDRIRTTMILHKGMWSLRLTCQAQANG
jgi:hypothetical protein